MQIVLLLTVCMFIEREWLISATAAEK